MEITILQENFNKALTVVGRIASSSGQLPILSTVLINAGNDGVSFSTTNLELSMNYWIGAKVIKPGKIVVPVKQILEVVSSMPAGKITVLKDKDQLIISCQKAKAEINLMDAEEFPKIPTSKDNKSKAKTITFKGGEISECISKVVYSASHDETRAVLTGIYMTSGKKGLRLVATDGYRLSYYEFEGKELQGIKKAGVLVPANAFNELSRTVGEEEELKISFDEKENQVFFTFPQGEIVSRLIEGEFPEYEKIIPEVGKKILADKEELSRAVKLASIFAREAANIIRLRLNKNELTVEANAAQVGKGSSIISTDYQGKEILIAFNYRFLNDLLGSINSGEVVLSLEDNLRPGVFLEKGKANFLHLIMPVRVQEKS